MANESDAWKRCSREAKHCILCNSATAMKPSNASKAKASHRIRSPRICRNDDQTLFIVAGNGSWCPVNIAHPAVGCDESFRCCRRMDSEHMLLLRAELTILAGPICDNISEHANLQRQSSFTAPMVPQADLQIG